MHYNDVIMSASASQITNLTIVYSTTYSRRRSKKASRLRVTDLCAGYSPVTGEIPAQRPVTRKMFPFDDVIMALSLHAEYIPKLLLMVRSRAFLCVLIYLNIDWNYQCILQDSFVGTGAISEATFKNMGKWLLTISLQKYHNNIVCIFHGAHCTPSMMVIVMIHAIYPSQVTSNPC